jgi:hypothetical protein
MPWPPYSPDLNPIKNLWALLKVEIYFRYPELQDAPNTVETLELLIHATKTTWETFDKTIINRLIDTMEHRVNSVIKSKGWYTKY